MRNIRFQQLVVLARRIVGCQGSTVNNCWYILSAFVDQTSSFAFLSGEKKIITKKQPKTRKVNETVL